MRQLLQRKKQSIQGATHDGLYNIIEKNKTEEWPQPTQMPSLYRACQHIVDGRHEESAMTLRECCSCWYGRSWQE